MNRDLAAFLCHTHSNLRASLPHHLQVQNQSESYVSNQVSRHQKVQNQSEQIVLFFKSSLKAPKRLNAYLGEMPSDRSATAWFSSEGVVLDLRVPSHTNNIVQANSHKKNF